MQSLLLGRVLKEWPIFAPFCKNVDASREVAFYKAAVFVDGASIGSTIETAAEFRRLVPFWAQRAVGRTEDRENTCAKRDCVEKRPWDITRTMRLALFNDERMAAPVCMVPQSEENFCASPVAGEGGGTPNSASTIADTSSDSDQSPCLRKSSPSRNPMEEIQLERRRERRCVDYLRMHDTPKRTRFAEYVYMDGIPSHWVNDDDDDYGIQQFDSLPWTATVAAPRASLPHAPFLETRALQMRYDVTRSNIRSFDLRTGEQIAFSDVSTGGMSFTKMCTYLTMRKWEHVVLVTCDTMWLVAALQVIARLHLLDLTGAVIPYRLSLYVPVTGDGGKPIVVELTEMLGAMSAKASGMHVLSLALLYYAAAAGHVTHANAEGLHEACQTLGPKTAATRNAEAFDDIHRMIDAYRIKHGARAPLYSYHAPLGSSSANVSNVLTINRDVWLAVLSAMFLVDTPESTQLLNRCIWVLEYVANGHLDAFLPRVFGNSQQVYGDMIPFQSKSHDCLSGRRGWKADVVERVPSLRNTALRSYSPRATLDPYDRRYCLVDVTDGVERLYNRGNPSVEGQSDYTRKLAWLRMSPA